MRIYVTYILVLLTVIVFLLTTLGYASSESYGFSPDFLQRPYIMLTAIFLHGDIVHLLSNIIALLIFGVAVEDELNAAKMLTLFFAGGILGEMITLGIYFETAIGASAGIFALIGAGMILRPVDIDNRMPLPLYIIGGSYVAYSIYGLITGIDPEISYISHIAGAILGLAAGFYIKKLRKQDLIR